MTKNKILKFILLMTISIFLFSSAYAKDEISSHFIEANGIRIHYLEMGKGPLVILLHGWPETAYSWRLTMPALAAHYHVVAPDLRGLGLSERTVSGYDKKAIATDIKDLIIAIGETHAIVVGHDMGGKAASEENLITNAFLYLNKFWADKGKSLSRRTTERYFTPDTTLIINGKTVYKGYDQFDTHFKAVGKTIRGEILFPLLDVINEKNKIVVHFNEDIRDNNGHAYPSNVIAIFTLKNGKIQRWEEVVNSNYSCQPEAMSVVYSK